MRKSLARMLGIVSQAQKPVMSILSDRTEKGLGIESQALFRETR
ncbi:MAG: hypothetical protein KR126chlam1_00536 [Chlamydiae bacterium]|nr:hypothetical protein [Chlamydiota bacterium]